MGARTTSRLVATLILCFGSVAVAKDGSGAAAGNGTEPLAANFAPAQTLASSAELLERGKQVYARQCQSCHGESGRGDGEAAYLLYPRPRDFTTGRFRLVSTWEGIPSDEDLFRTISRGMPGSAMPAWAHLPERDRWALVHYIKTFSKHPLEVAPSSPPKAEGEMGTGVIVVPPEPPYDAAAQERAKELFRDACASCHGATGKGDGVSKQVDEKGYPIQPRDLTAGIFKGSPQPRDLYQRIIAGSPGTPMPASEWAYGKDAWHLVHFVRSLSSDAQRARAEARRRVVRARRVEKLPEEVQSALWDEAPVAGVSLMPLWWRSPHPDEVAVRALHDGKEIAFLLEWADPTHDASVVRVQDFRDGVALELSATPDPPFFAMGERGASVNIWMWKSERQSDLAGYRDLESVYPALAIDGYPNPLEPPTEQQRRNVSTLSADPMFITGWGAENLVSDPTRRNTAEDLSAEGFGTLRARPAADQQVQATGRFEKGTYRVLLRRALRGKGPGAVSLKAGQHVPVAFAVWDGSAGDRNGKKSVSIWQDLALDQ